MGWAEGIFLDDEAVAYYSQRGRKRTEGIRWISKDKARRVIEYLKTLAYVEEEEYIDIIDINEDIGDSYRLNYNNQLIKGQKVTYKGQNITILERIKNKPYGIDDMLKIGLPGGGQLEVKIYDLEFRYNLREDK